MEMKDLDSLNCAVHILNAIKDIMIFLESSMIKTVPVSVYIVFETALEKSVSLLEKVAEAMDENLTEAGNESQ